MFAKTTRDALLALLCCVLLGCGCRGRAAPEATLVRPTPMYIPTDSSAAWLTAEALFLSDEVCAPPCWQGIIPGVSFEEDVLRVLGQLEARGVSYSRIGSRYDNVGVSFLGIDIMLEDKRVKYMWGVIYPYDYHMKHVVERLGEPEAVAPKDAMPGMEGVSPHCEDLEDFPDWDPTGSFFLLYPSKGATYVVTRYYYGYVCPEMQVVQFFYYEPTSLEEALSEHGSLVFGERDFGGEDIVEWHGYGDGY